ncbi:MAG: PD-(D/E)XK nuclease family protein [Planctomycetes bacterium]|nr:PD-(D/E)XK nuclease family protein [Planctomycetota bacterium]
MNIEIDHFSVSQVNEFLRCQIQYFLHRIEEKETVDVSDALIVGSAYHCALEMYYKGQKDGNPAGINDMQAVFEQVIREEEESKTINWGRSDRDDTLIRDKDVFAVFLEDPDAEVG